MATLGMITCGRLHLVLVTLLCVGLVTGRPNNQSYCTTESVVEGQPASVTCHFPEDVTVHKHSVNIIRYDFSGGSFVPELILACFWKLHSKRPNCSVANHFEFDSQISDSLKVSTRAATKRHAGSYACNYGGDVPSEFNICRMNVKDPVISCTATAVKLDGSATVTCRFNTNVNQSKEGFYVKRIPTKLDSGGEFDVLTCNWVEQLEDGIFCHTKEGCALVTKSIGDEVTVRIEKLDRNYAGEYFCDTVPHTKGVIAEHCLLTPQETTSDTTTEEPVSPATGTGKSLHKLLFYHFCITLLALCFWRETKR